MGTTDMFAMMMKRIFEQEVGEDSIEDFLLMLSCAKKQKNQIDNQDEHHRLQKLVDNGMQLDHADEVKLNKLEATHQKYIDYVRKKRKVNRDQRHACRQWHAIGSF
jgi:hypothetical protein